LTYFYYSTDREIVNAKIAPFFQIRKTGKAAIEIAVFPMDSACRGAPNALESQKFLPNRPDFLPRRAGFPACLSSGLRIPA
jgi:hypothetical protein